MWNALEEYKEIKVGDTLYFAEIMPVLGHFEVQECKVRSIAVRDDDKDNYIVGIEKRTKRAYVWGFSDIDKLLFTNRNECLDVVKDAENEFIDKCGKGSLERFLEKD